MFKCVATMKPLHNDPILCQPFIYLIKSVIYPDKITLAFFSLGGKNTKQLNFHQLPKPCSFISLPIIVGFTFRPKAKQFNSKFDTNGKNEYSETSGT